MIEAKMKEQAIFKLYEKYPELNCKITDVRASSLLKITKLKGKIKIIQ